MVSKKQNNVSGRVMAVDVLRGLTVCLMILVDDNVGVEFEFLKHPLWTGISLADFVFPSFITLMGVSMYFSLSKYDFKFSGKAIFRILRRFVLLFVCVAKAAEMMFTSDPISGVEAVQWGLANRSFTDEDLMPKTLEIAKKIAKKSPIALKAAIHTLQYSKPASFFEGVAAEAESFGTVFVSEDAKEGIQAFIEKREPVFKGK